MIHMSRVTTKYQVTIPNEIRELLKVGVGDRIMFRVDDNGEVVIKTMKKITPEKLAGTLNRSQVQATEQNPSGSVSSMGTTPQWSIEGRAEE